MSEWISVEDRLPEDSGCYLVAGELIELEIDNYCIDYGWNDSFEVTHWQPLPEPPKP